MTMLTTLVDDKHRKLGHKFNQFDQNKESNEFCLIWNDKYDFTDKDDMPVEIVYDFNPN